MNGSLPHGPIMKNICAPAGRLCYRLNPAEALTAVTLNAAAAIDRAETIGTIESGKKADIVIWDAPDLDMIFYRYGANQVKTVIKSGRVLQCCK